MKRFIVLFLLYTVCAVGYAQELAPVVIASAGKEYKVENYSIAFTIGEVTVKTISGIDHTLTQGFHQPPGLYLSDITKNEAVDISVSVFPNPTTDLVNIVIRNAELHANCELKIYNSLGQDVNAKVIKYNDYGDFVFTIDLSDKSQGTYFIRLFNVEQNSNYLDFKVVKLKY